MKTLNTKRGQSRTFLGILCTLFFFLAAHSGFAQKASTNITVGSETYKVDVQLKDNLFTITLDDSDNFKSTKFTNYFTFTTFKNIVFSEHESNLKAQAIAASQDPSLVIVNRSLPASESALSNAFLELLTIVYNKEEGGQRIGHITLKDKILIEGPKKSDSTLSDRNYYLEVASAQIVFEDGAIRHILIEGLVDGKKRVYSNKFSIGASTRRNIQDFLYNWLYPEPLVDHGGKIRLSNAIEYEREVALRTNDFSPADIAIIIFPNKRQELFKSSSSELFTMNIFSDFAGFNNENPNGLVQFEFNKRINLWTKKRDLGKALGFGMFSHMTPRFELAKIEENNRDMRLSTFEAITGNTNYLNPLQLFRFSYARISNEINLIDIQGASVSIHANLSAGIAVTSIQDTVQFSNQQRIFNENVNSLMLGINLRSIFNPESKWSYELSHRTTYLDPLSDNFIFRSLENGELQDANNLISMWEFLLTWNTGSKNKIFGRFRFNHETEYIRNNFAEFQLGYSIFLKSSKASTSASGG